MGKCYAEYYGEMIGNEDMASVGMPHAFLCRPDLPEDLVYETMKLFFGHLKELYAFHLEAPAYLGNLARSGRCRGTAERAETPSRKAGC